jgi:DNA-binding TFAR19-related protein (PDSD5 family)
MANDILDALNSNNPKDALSSLMASKSSDEFKRDTREAVKSLSKNVSTKQNSLSTSSGVGIAGSIAGALNSSIAAFSSEQTSQFSQSEIVGIGNLLDVIQKNGLSVKTIFGAIGVVGDQILNQLGRESQLRTDINESIGIAGDLSKTLRDDIVDSTAAGIRFGYGMNNVRDMIKKIMEESGRFNLISQKTIESTFATSRAFIGDLRDMGEAISQFEKIGVGASSATVAIEKAGKGSLELGLSGKKTTQDLRTNIEKLNEFGFKNGIQGLAEMSRKATEFRINMGEAFKIAENVMDPDKAIELSANLQVLGGAIGDFNDPLKLMYMATNNVEGLQDALIEAAGSLATYNSEQGRFEISGVNLRRAREMAKTLGIDYKELTRTAIASQERLAASTALMGKGFNMKPEDQEFLTNLSRMEGGKMIIDVPESLQKKLGITEQSKAIEDLSQVQINALLQNREQFQKMSVEDIARDQLDNVENIRRDVAAMVQMQLRNMTRIGRDGINGSGGIDDITKLALDKVTDFTNKTFKENPDLIKSGIEGAQNMVENFLNNNPLISAAADYLGDKGKQLKENLFEQVKKYFGGESTTTQTQTTQPTTTTKNVNLSVTVPNIADQLTNEIMRSQGVWKDVLKNSDAKDYLTL